jgi:hypothetical protein
MKKAVYGRNFSTAASVYTTTMLFAKDSIAGEIKHTSG